jgi:uncharacterized protein (TIGR03435 family)
MDMEMERTMASLAQQLTPMLDSPVVDHTGLKGAYTIGLDLSLQNLMQVAQKAEGTPHRRGSNRRAGTGAESRISYRWAFFALHR